jgi:hypothetical protein
MPKSPSNAIARDLKPGHIFSYSRNATARQRMKVLAKPEPHSLDVGRGRHKWLLVRVERLCGQGTTMIRPNRLVHLHPSLDGIYDEHQAS